MSPGFSCFTSATAGPLQLRFQPPLLLIHMNGGGRLAPPVYTPHPTYMQGGTSKACHNPFPSDPANLQTRDQGMDGPQALLPIPLPPLTTLTHEHDQGTHKCMASHLHSTYSHPTKHQRPFSWWPSHSIWHAHFLITSHSLTSPTLPSSCHWISVQKPLFPGSWPLHPFPLTPGTCITTKKPN